MSRRGTNKDFLADVGSGVLFVVVHFCSINASEQNRAVGNNITAGLALKEDLLACLGDKVSEKLFDTFCQEVDVKLLFSRKLMVRRAEAATEIYEFKIVKLVSNAEQVRYCRKVRVGLHEE